VAAEASFLIALTGSLECGVCVNGGLEETLVAVQNRGVHSIPELVEHQLDRCKLIFILLSHRDGRMEPVFFLRKSTPSEIHPLSLYPTKMNPFQIIKLLKFFCNHSLCSLF
jgi:hypothetical protein